jgi:hypothetical protein
MKLEEIDRRAALCCALVGESIVILTSTFSVEYPLKFKCVPVYI